MSDILEALQSLKDNGIRDDTYNCIVEELIHSAEFPNFCDEEQRHLTLIFWLHENDGYTVEPDELSTCSYDELRITYGSTDYLVLTDDEADDVAAERVGETLWAFNPDFLAGETGIDFDVFKALQPKCEDANGPIKSLIEGSCGMDSFIQEAISSDGRGHFLSNYDGEENECDTAGEMYFIYRN